VNSSNDPNSSNDAGTITINASSTTPIPPPVTPPSSGGAGDSGGGGGGGSVDLVMLAMLGATLLATVRRKRPAGLSRPPAA
jgi:hypothetical protein